MAHENKKKGQPIGYSYIDKFKNLCEETTMPGSHGSLTKAGKVRESTPKVKGRERHTPIPRIRNKRNFEKRFIRGQTVGVRK